MSFVLLSVLFCYFYHDEIDKVRAAVPGICSLWLSTPLILGLSEFPAEGESFPVRLCADCVWSVRVGRKDLVKKTSLLCLFSKLCGRMRSESWQRNVCVGWERQVDRI